MFLTPTNIWFLKRLSRYGSGLELLLIASNLFSVMDMFHTTEAVKWFAELIGLEYLAFGSECGACTPSKMPVLFINTDHTSIACFKVVFGSHRTVITSFLAGGGNEQVEFSVGPDEFIAGVKGRSGAYVDSIRFVTSAGRESPRYGSNGGDKAYEFSSGAPVCNNIKLCLVIRFLYPAVGLSVEHTLHFIT